MLLTDKDRLNFILESLKLGPQAFSETLQVPVHKIKSIKIGKVKISPEIALSIEQKFNFDFKWILTGEGHPYIKEGSQLGGQVHEPPQPYGHQYGDNPEVAELLAMTREIVRSDTSYALSLMANIRSFHQAMLAERRYQDIEARLARIEQEKSIDNHVRLNTGNDRRQTDRRQSETSTLEQDRRSGSDRRKASGGKR
jgi:hypothetical protein